MCFVKRFITNPTDLIKQCDGLFISQSSGNRLCTNTKCVSQIEYAYINVCTYVHTVYVNVNIEMCMCTICF